MDIFEQYLLGVIEESRVDGIILLAFNVILISLIPKSDRVGNLECYRPISLCNCIYKVIAKVIAKRIRDILSSLVSHEQFSSLAGI